MKKITLYLTVISIILTIVGLIVALQTSEEIIEAVDNSSDEPVMYKSDAYVLPSHTEQGIFEYFDIEIPMNFKYSTDNDLQMRIIDIFPISYTSLYPMELQNCLFTKTPQLEFVDKYVEDMKWDEKYGIPSFSIYDSFMYNGKQGDFPISENYFAEAVLFSNQNRHDLSIQGIVIDYDFNKESIKGYDNETNFEYHFGSVFYKILAWDKKTDSVDEFVGVIEVTLPITGGQFVDCIEDPISYLNIKTTVDNVILDKLKSPVSRIVN